MQLPAQLVKSASFENVAAGAVATLTLPTDGRRLRKLFLQADENSGGGIVATADKIELVIGNRTIRTVKPTEMADIVDLNGVDTFGETAESSIYFQIPFCAEWMRTAAEEDVLGLGTGDIRGDVQLKVTLKSGITNITLEAWEEIDYPVNANGAALGVGELMRLDKYTIPQTSAGVYRWQSMPRKGKLHRLHIFSSFVSEVLVKANGVTVHESELAGNNDRLKRYGFNPATGVYHVVFDIHQRLAEHIALDQLASFVVELTATSGVSQYDIVAEYRDII